MSRTYRLRHMPKKGAKKFVDSRVRTRFYQHNKMVERYVDDNFPNLNFCGRRAVERQIEKDNPLPVMHKAWYQAMPFGFGIIGTWAKTYSKRRGHKYVRQMTREAFQKDPDEAVWPHPLRDAFDIWVIS